MLYAKNVGSKERIVRTVGGTIMILCGAVGLQLSPLGLLLAGTGVVTIVTGLIGFCPACAMVGRKPVERVEVRQ
jgi:Inner membrane protein YgaP-like, transmembrane domain